MPLVLPMTCRNMDKCGLSASGKTCMPVVLDASNCHLQTGLMHASWQAERSYHKVTQRHKSASAQPAASAKVAYAAAAMK